MNSTNTSEERIDWRCDIEAAEWDRMLAELGGHPLQSALWGNARRVVDNVHDHRWMMVEHNKPLLMMRIEERRVPPVGTIGWIPRGPASELPIVSGDFFNCSKPNIEKYGFSVLIADPWERLFQSSQVPILQLKKPKTIWINLEKGKDALLEGLDKQWRYGVRRAKKRGVSVEPPRSDGDVAHFFDLCLDISKKKGFSLPASLSLMKYLLKEGGADVEAQLFLAYQQGKIGAGVFVIRCGRSIHYFWGAVNRAFGKERVGEAVQWAAIEWGISKSCTRYDLEGIDPKRNRSVYEFKKRLGGEEVYLVGRRHYPLNARGRIIAYLDKFRP